MNVSWTTTPSPHLAYYQMACPAPRFVASVPSVSRGGKLQVEFKLGLLASAVAVASRGVADEAETGREISFLRLGSVIN